MLMSFHFSSFIYERYLSERIIRRFVFSLCFLPESSVFCVLFSVVLTDVVVMLLPFLLYAPLICMFPCCWITLVCVSLINILNTMKMQCKGFNKIYGYLMMAEYGRNM
jgi:hypothetical protein